MIDVICADQQCSVTVEQIEYDEQLYGLMDPPEEDDLESYLVQNIFEAALDTRVLQSARNTRMRQRNVPEAQPGNAGIYTPKPDILYRYRIKVAFPNHVPQVCEATVNDANVVYPFFTIAHRGDQTSMHAAENQCFGSAATCINVIECFNNMVESASRESHTVLIPSYVFSIAVRGMEFRLFISWKHGHDEYRTFNFENVLLSNPDSHLKLRKIVANIFSWGEGLRRDAILAGLDCIASRPANPSLTQDRRKRGRLD